MYPTLSLQEMNDLPRAPQALFSVQGFSLLLLQEHLETAPEGIREIA